MADKSELLEMAKALYQFKATIAKTLSFRDGEHFLIYQTSTKQRNWWQVINNKAQVGYVPSNYVVSVQVAPNVVMKFIEECVSALRKESDKAGGVLSNDRHELLLKLIERRDKLERNLEAIQEAPAPPDFMGSPTSCSSASRISPPLIFSQPVRPAQSAPVVCDTKEDILIVEKIVERFEKNERKTPEKPKKPEKIIITQKPAVPPKNEIKVEKPEKTPSHGKSEKHEKHERVEKHDKVEKVEKFEKFDKFGSPEPKKVVSEIKGQVGPSLAEARKSITSISSEIEEIRNFSRRNSSHDNEVINEETVYHLVEQVRCHTELSHDRSRIAVAVVLSDLERFMPHSAILKKMLLLLQGPINVPQLMIEHTHDAKRLKVIFSELTSCKDDAQQRSWMLHEDEDIIIDYIKELTSILMNADASICRHVISNDQYAGVVALAQYYQMEVRWSIRQPLLQALGVLCSLDRAIISIFLTSVLPMELARDMKSNPRNIPKLNYSALLLTMIFSMGEPMPITHLEYLGLDFISFILDLIEDPPDTDAEDQIPDLFVTLILSYNLQFNSVNDNVLIKAISERSVAKTFTEKILLLLNREDDPVRIFDHEPAPLHSVLKLFVDLFSNTSAANLFYTNDVKVLIDIIVRQLADISPGDPRRHQYLQLCRVVMRNSGYSDHHHRKDDLLKSFTRIFCEETEVSLRDQQLVREISNEFPQYFKS